MRVITAFVRVGKSHLIPRAIGGYFHRNVGGGFFVPRINVHIAGYATVIFFRYRPTHERVSVNFHSRVVVIGNIYRLFPVNDHFFLNRGPVFIEKHHAEFRFFEIGYVTLRFVYARIFALRIRIAVRPADEHVSRFGYGNYRIRVAAADDRLFGIPLYTSARARGISKHAIDLFDLYGNGVLETAVTDGYRLFFIHRHVESLVRHTAESDFFLRSVAVSNGKVNLAEISPRAYFFFGITDADYRRRVGFRFFGRR